MKFNFRDFVLIILVGSFGYLMFNSLVYNKPKVVYVDSNLIVSEYLGVIKAQKEIEKKEQLLTANLDSLFARFDQEIKLYESERISMTKKEIQLKEEILNNKQAQLRSYREIANKKFEEECTLIMQEPINSINEFLDIPKILVLRQIWGKITQLEIE